MSKTDNSLVYTATDETVESLETTLTLADKAFEGYQFQAALDLYAQTLTLAESDKENWAVSSIIIRAHIGIGNCRRYLSQTEESVTNFDKAIEYIKFRTGFDRSNQKNNLENKLPEEINFDKSISETKINFRDDLKMLADALWGKAEALRLLNQFELALPAFEESAKASQAVGDSGMLANSLWAKANILEKTQQYDLAIVVYQDSFKVAKSANESSSAASALSGIANTLRRQGRLEEATPVCEEAIKFARFSQNKMVYANALNSLGQVSELRKKYEDAKRAYKGAREIGQLINYGHAVIAAKAGLRRIETLEAQANKEAEREAEVNKITLGVVNPAMSLVAKPYDDKLERFRNAIYRIYGSRVMEQIEGLDEDAMRSYMPDGRVWTVVLMCDIRGYTTAMSRADAEEQFLILNRYLSRGTEIINDIGGGVDKYMGDAILAFFLPENVENPTERDIADTINTAIKTAFNLVEDSQLTQLFNEFRERYSDLSDNDFGLGVGLAVGYAKFGEIGANQRREYTLIGRPVNLAARVQSTSKTGEVVCTYECWSKFERSHEEAGTYNIKNLVKDESMYKYMKGYENDKVVQLIRK